MTTKIQHNCDKKIWYSQSKNWMNMNFDRSRFFHIHNKKKGFQYINWKPGLSVGAVDGTWTHMNLRSLPPQSSASAIPPRPHMKLFVVLRDGIEPPTRGFSVPCSTDWATWANMATSIGFEPTIFAVTGRHVKPLHHEAVSTSIFKARMPRTKRIVSCIAHFGKYFF